MKRIITAAILMIGTTLGVSNRASAQEPAVRADVPFDFAVGSHVLPAGNYQIAAHGDSLVFDHVGGQYFLRRIVSTNAKVSADFPMSKLETKSEEIAETRSIYATTSSR